VAVEERGVSELWADIFEAGKWLSQLMLLLRVSRERGGGRKVSLEGWESPGGPLKTSAFDKRLPGGEFLFLVRLLIQLSSCSIFGLPPEKSF